MQGILKNVIAAGAAAAGSVNNNEVDPDPDKILLAYVAYGTAPLWVDPRLETDCHHCRDKFKKGHQHYCRLCGHQFCSMCTGKYHVPDEFKKKGKEGAVRVCFDCRDATLERRSRVDPLPKPLRPRLKSRRVNGALHIYPPQWAQQFEYENCVQCRVTYGKHPYHCRVCGEMFCSSCTVKTEVPNTFRKKINKTGPVRVCFECRHKIRGGAYLERDNSQIPHDMMADDRRGGGGGGGGGGYAASKGGRAVSGYGSIASASGSFGSFLSPAGAQFRRNGDVDNDVTQVSYTDDDYDPLATMIAGKKATPMQASKNITLDVLKKGKEGTTMTAVTTLELPKSCTLVDVHEDLLAMFPSLKQRQFHYLCRDAPVLEVHWDIFDLTHFKEIVIAKGPPVYGTQSQSSPAAPPVGNANESAAQPAYLSATDKTSNSNSATARSDSSSSSSSLPVDKEPTNVDAAVASHRQSSQASPNPAYRNRPAGLGANIGIKMPGATQINNMRKDAQRQVSPVSRGNKSPHHDFGAPPRLNSSPGLKPQSSYHAQAKVQNSSPQQLQQPQARKAKLVGVPTTHPDEEDVPPPPISRSATPTPLSAPKQTNSKRARRKMSLPHPNAIWVRCKYTYTAQTPTNISFNKLDVLVVIKHESDSQWWFGEHIRNDINEGARVRGWFPSTYVRQCEAPDDPNDTDSDTDDDEYTRRHQRPPVQLPAPKAVRASQVGPPVTEEEHSRFSDKQQSSPYQSPSLSPYQAPASLQRPPGEQSPDMSITAAAFRSGGAPSPMSLNHKKPVLQQPKPQKQRPTSPLIHGVSRASASMPGSMGGLGGGRSSGSRPVGAIGGPRGAPNFRMPSRESSPALPHSSPNNGSGMQRSSSAMRRSPMAAPRLTSPPMDRSSSAMGRLASDSNGNSGGTAGQRSHSPMHGNNSLPPAPREDTIPGPPPADLEDVPPPSVNTNPKSSYSSGRRTLDKNTPRSARTDQRFSVDVDPFTTPGASRSATPVQQLQHPDVQQESARRADHRRNASNGRLPSSAAERSSPSLAASRSSTLNPFLNAPGMEETDETPPSVAAPASPFSDDEDEDEDGEKSPTAFNRPTGGYLSRKGKINPVRKKRQAGRRITLLQSSRGLFDD